MPRPRPMCSFRVIVSVLLAGVAGYLIGLRQHTRPTVAPSAASRAARVGARDMVVAPRADEASHPASDQEPWDERWRRLAAAPRTPELEAQRAELLAMLASREPERAMQLALAEPNWSVRAKLRNAVLRGWAESDPRRSAAYALSLRDDERPDAMAAVFKGAEKDLDTLQLVAGDVCDRDPDRAFQYSQTLIGQLGEHGDFTAAVHFLTQRPSSPQRVEEMCDAFTQWAENQPSTAAAAAGAITDAQLRDAAFRGAAVGWSRADPVGLAEYALQLPPGESRSLALANAVPRWVEHDPVAAATWLAQRDPDPDFDMGVAAIATVPSMITDRPQLAMSLAQGITDPSLRMTTLEALAQHWAEVDTAAATQYVKTSSGITDAERAMLLADIRGARG